MKRVCCILGGAVAAFAFVGNVWADSPPSAARVEAALGDLHRFVGDGDNGQRWRAYLKSSELAAQLSNGAAADQELLESILSRYSAEVSGLQMPQFVAVRSALSAWHRELTEAQPQNLAEMARAAAGKYRPVSPAEIDRARGELRAAMSSLDALLQNSPEEEEVAWRTYLRWEELTEQATRAAGADPEVVEPILSQFSAYENGLAMRQFTGVRRALRRYLEASAAADPKTQETYGKNLEALATHLENFDKTASPDEALSAARIVAWLRRHGQAEELAAAVSRRFNRPNVFATVSERFLKAGIESEVDRTQGVTDNILGTQIYGTARTTGRTLVELVPNDRSARFDIRLVGQAASNNIGYNGPVTIHSTGLTNINGHKVLVMNADGLYGYGATANCATSTNIYSIQSCCRLIEKLAWNRAGQQKGQAEAIASSHAAGRVAGQMDAEASDLIADTNRRYAERVKEPLTARDAFPRQLRFSSTTEQVDVSAIAQGASGFAAAGGPPALAPGHDVSLRAHESSLVNFAEAMLGGVTLTDEKLEKIIREDLKAEVPEELKISPDTDPWSITFADEAPVRAIFSGGGLSIAVRGRRFTKGEQSVNEPIEISASYKIEKTPKGSTLTRQGKVEVKFLERERLTAQQIAIKTFFENRFEGVFKEEFVSEGIVLEGRLAKAGKLQVQEISSDQGWLAIGWQLAAAEAQSAPPAAGIDPEAPAVAAAE